MSSKSSPDCFCCLEPYNKSTRYRVRCPHYNADDKKTECGYESCRSCVRKYLLGHAVAPHCMNCKQPWERNFLISNLTRSWIDNTYSVHMQHLLFETEKARLAEDQEAAANYLCIKPLQESNRVIHKDIRKLQKQMRLLQDQAFANTRKIRNFENMQSSNSEKKKRKKFIRKCPDKDCNGFLSTAWKCEICKKTVCSKCLDWKITADPKENTAVAEHVCDENNVKTAALLKKDTKPCPSCGEQITKISGCDQMWCPECKNAWSWRNGVVIHGTIHNPHYYEWQRQMNNGVAPRVLGDVACGGVPQYYNWRQRVLMRYAVPPARYNRHNATADRELYTILVNLHRGINHFQDIHIRPVRRQIQVWRDNKRLRVLYICKVTSEKEMKDELLSRKKRIDKDTAKLQIYELYNTIATENIIDIYNHFDQKEHIHQCLRNIHQARIYVNRELMKLSYLWKRSVKIIVGDFGMMGKTMTSQNQLDKYLHENPLNADNTQEASETTQTAAAENGIMAATAAAITNALGLN